MSTTTTDLISEIKILGSFPATNDLFSNSDYLSILNREMLSVVIPVLNTVNQEYFITYQDTVVTSGTDTYRIPKRAIGGTLRDVQLIDTAGNVQNLKRLFEEDKTSTSSGLNGYYLKGNNIILSPTPTNSSDTLRQVYFRRPSKLVATSSCAVITAIDTVNNQVTVSATPTSMTTGTSIDFVQGESPYDLLNTSVSISGVSGTTISFTSLPTELAVGDYLCPAGESCLPMVPDELVPMLVQAALCVCLSSKKDKSVELELQKLEQMKQSIISMLVPRVKSDDVKVFNRNSILNYFR